MRKFLSKFRQDEVGATAIIGGVSAVGGKLSTTFTTVSTSI